MTTVAKGALRAWWVGAGSFTSAIVLFRLFAVGGAYNLDLGQMRISAIVNAGCLLLGLFGLCTLFTADIRKGFSYTGMILLALFLLAPFVWMVLVSLHPSKTPIPTLDLIVPKEPAWDNYGKVLFMPNLPVSRFFLNTLFVTFAVVFGQLFVSSLAAYGFARFQFKWREPTFGLFLGSMMFAGPVTQIPVYLIVQKFGWLDTYAALIIPGVSSAFTIFLLRQAFLAIPKELDEAAKIDGAGYFRIYWRVLLPLAKPSLATAAAFTFFGVWTDFFWPMLSTNSTEMRTLEVGLSIFKNSYGQANWPLQMTAAVIVMAPLLVVFLFCQRYFVKGVMMGSIK